MRYQIRSIAHVDVRGRERGPEALTPWRLTLRCEGRKQHEEEHGTVTVSVTVTVRQRLGKVTQGLKV